jgi:sugar phosphate isomerase/epimerase
MAAQTSTPRLKRDLFGIGHYLCPPDVKLLDFLDAVAARGFTGVGLTERAMEEVPVTTLGPALKARGLRVTSVNSAGYFLRSGSEAERQAARNQWILDYAAELEAAPINVIVGGIGQGLGLRLDEARLRAREALVALHARAATLGLHMIVEPVHPNGAWQKGCFNSLRQVTQAISGLANATINLDIFHSWWDPELNDVLRDEESPLGMFQMCDVGAFTTDGIAQRVPLGEGVIDIPRLLTICLQRKRQPLFEVELFAAQLPGRPLLGLLDQTVTYLNGLDR